MGRNRIQGLGNFIFLGETQIATHWLEKWVTPLLIDIESIINKILLEATVTCYLLFSTLLRSLWWGEKGAERYFCLAGIHLEYLA